ncbi:MAG: prephenate dehydrogenase [Pseudomonadota bacterium]
MKVGLVGSGLIGGSIVKAIAEAGVASEIAVYDKSAKHAAAVAEDIAEASVFENVEDMSTFAVILIATPVLSIAEYVDQLASSNAVLIDAGSAKCSILKMLEDNGGVPANYVPGHPLGGHTSTGPGRSDPAIITGSPYLLTPVAQTDPKAVVTARSFLESIGADVRELDPVLHDRFFALASHLPHLLSYALVRSLEELPEDDRDIVRELLPNSFRSLSAFARSDPTMWRDIFSANRDDIQAASERLYSSIEALLADATQVGASKLETELQKLRDLRRELDP